MIKRFLAHATQIVSHLYISTQLVAKSATHILYQFFDTLKKIKMLGLKNSLKRLLKFLSTQAGRASPKKEKYAGRLIMGWNVAYDMA